MAPAQHHRRHLVTDLRPRLQHSGCPRRCPAQRLQIGFSAILAQGPTFLSFEILLLLNSAHQIRAHLDGGDDQHESPAKHQQLGAARPQEGHVADGADGRHQGGAEDYAGL